MTPEPITVKFPTILEMPAPQLRGYPRETVVAEKVHAMVVLGTLNSRMKDFYDLWVLARHFNFEGSTLQDAIVQTFRQRNTIVQKDLPVALSEQFAHDKQSQWQVFSQNTMFELGSKDFVQIIHDCRAFLFPLLQACAMNQRFDKIWQAGGDRWTHTPESAFGADPSGFLRERLKIKEKGVSNVLYGPLSPQFLSSSGSFRFFFSPRGRKQSFFGVIAHLALSHFSSQGTCVIWHSSLAHYTLIPLPA